MIRRMESYVYIDGGYLELVYLQFAQAWFGHQGGLDYEKVFSGVGCDHPQLHWKRGFYYDCPVKQKRGEDDLEFQSRRDTQEERWKKIRAISGGHLRTGKITGERKQRQKGVDVLIAVNVLSHVARGNFDKVVLLAGDADFLPLVDAVVEMGAIIDVAASAKSISTDMINAPDHFREITTDDLFAWTVKSLQDEFPIPKSLGHTVAGEGSHREVEWIGGGTSPFVRQAGTWKVSKPDGSGSYSHKSLEELKRFLEIRYTGCSFGESNIPDQ